MKRSPFFCDIAAQAPLLADVQGWEVAGQFSTPEEEHRAVRERVGLFDYLLMTAWGSNAADERPEFDLLREYGQGLQVAITDVSPGSGLLAIGMSTSQGPRSRALLGDLIGVGPGVRAAAAGRAGAASRRRGSGREASPGGGGPKATVRPGGKAAAARGGVGVRDTVSAGRDRGIGSTSINLQFTEQDWERVERAWRAWWAGDLDRPLVVIEDLAYNPGVTISNMHNLGDPACCFPLDVPGGEVLDYYQVRLEAKRFYGDAWPKWFPNFGPGILAGSLGAQVHATPDTVWFEPAEPVAIEDLNPTFDPKNVWWRRVLELTRLAVERWGNRVCVAHTDLGGNLDILASLLGAERLLLDLHDHPEEVARLAGEITACWLRCYDELDAAIQAAGRGTTPWATIWSPGRCYMLQSDFSAMISPRMFERLVLPDLAACCEALDHSFYHMDGRGQVVHLDLLLSLECLDGIQWIPGAGAPPPEAWLPLLKRIRDAGKLCQLYVSPEGARVIVRALGGRGFAFYVDRRMARDEAEDFLRLLGAKGPGID